MKNIKLKQTRFFPGMTLKFLRNFLHLFIMLLLFSFGSNAQYFYKDIWSNEQAIKEFSILKNENFKIVKIKSFEDDGQPSEGFFCEKKINKNYTQSEMISKSYITGQSLLVSDYDNGGRPVKTTDNTPTTTSSTLYEYDSKGRLTKVETVTKADDDLAGITEIHEYFYEGDSLVKMIRKKNNLLISTIHFVNDASGNVIISGGIKFAILLADSANLVVTIRSCGAIVPFRSCCSQFLSLGCRCRFRSQLRLL